MHHIGPGELHYIAADLESRAWLEAGFARLDDYLARWSLFRRLYPEEPRWIPHGSPRD